MKSYDRFKKYSYCVGSRHHSRTNNVKPAVSFKKTPENRLNYSRWSVAYVEKLKQK